MEQINTLTYFDLLKNLKGLIKNKFNKDSIRFIQIGANDGVTNDVASHVLETTDNGIFIEPMEGAFNLLLENKKNFINSSFLKLALLPEILKDNNKMNLLSQDELRQGSSFLNLNQVITPYSERIIDQIEVETITVENLINEHNIVDLDFLFCDVEGIDSLIVDNFLEKIKPEVMFFESCGWWCNEDIQIQVTNNNIVSIPSRHKFKLKLESLGYYVIDFTDKDGRDVVAFKTEYITPLCTII